MPSGLPNLNPIEVACFSIDHSIGSEEGTELEQAKLLKLALAINLILSLTHQSIYIQTLNFGHAFWMMTWRTVDTSIQIEFPL